MPHLPFKPIAAPPSSHWAETQSMIAMEPEPPTACVFVHGWSGNGSTTWTGFPELIRLSPRAEGVDFFFFTYDSVQRTAAYSAARFRKFLEALVANPGGTLVNPTIGGVQRYSRPAGFQYRKLIICAHSMGAVVSRLAMLDIESASPGTLHALRTRLLLFAPAHKGTDLVELGKELLSGSLFGIPLSVVKGASLVKARSLLDLETGSPTLTRLEEGNRQARSDAVARGRDETPFKARVLHADDDLVVRQDNFDADPPFEPIPGQAHTTICKPTAGFPTPFTELEALL